MGADSFAVSCLQDLENPTGKPEHLNKVLITVSGCVSGAASGAFNYVCDEWATIGDSETGPSQATDNGYRQGNSAHQFPTLAVTKTAPSWNWRANEPSYARTNAAGQVISVACEDTGDYVDGTGVTRVWQAGAGSGLGDTKCVDFEEHRSWCINHGASYYNPNGINAITACCVCGGGVRVEGTRLKVEVRDPAADGLVVHTPGQSEVYGEFPTHAHREARVVQAVSATIDIMVTNANAECVRLGSFGDYNCAETVAGQIDSYELVPEDALAYRAVLNALTVQGLRARADLASPKVDTTRLTGLNLQHTTNIYEAPDLDWCVAQRVDTAEFFVYVFDMEDPVIECPEKTVVCAEDLQASKPVLAANQRVGDLAGYAANYADILITQPPPDAMTPNFPNVWPISVTDNVNADMVFDSTGDRTGAGTPPTYSMTTPIIHTPDGHTESDWEAATAYETHAAIIGVVASAGTRLGSDLGVAYSSYPGTTELSSVSVIGDGINRFAIGDYTVTFTATDSFGNTDTCVAELEVKDCAPPLLLCTDSSTSTVVSKEPGVTPGSCYCLLMGVTATAWDNSGVSPKVSLIGKSLGVSSKHSACIDFRDKQAQHLNRLSSALLSDGYVDADRRRLQVPDRADNHSRHRQGSERRHGTRWERPHKRGLLHHHLRRLRTANRHVPPGFGRHLRPVPTLDRCHVEPRLRVHRRHQQSRGAQHRGRGARAVQAAADRQPTQLHAAEHKRRDCCLQRQGG